MRRAIATMGIILLTIVGSLGSADAHNVVGFWFAPTMVDVAKAGVYQVDVTIDPYYGNIGWIVRVDQATIPEGVIMMMMPPFGYTMDASQNKYAKLLVIVTPGAPNGSYYPVFDVTQIIPPGPTDETRINGPYLSIHK